MGFGGGGRAVVLLLKLVCEILWIDSRVWMRRETLQGLVVRGHLEVEAHLLTYMYVARAQ